jgi:micrococcal nuclease
MRRPLRATALFLVLAAVAASPHPADAGTEAAPGVPGGPRTPPSAAQVATVRKIVDGDTLEVRVGGTNVRVRLLQIDTPEVDFVPECWGRQASTALARLLPRGTRVTLYADPALDRTDRFGRALRYVFRGTTNVNVRMVAQGDAAPYFFDGERGRYAAGLERVALAARRSRLGLWGACPAAVYDPYRALDTGPPPR